jgi:hypothetical protein
MHDRESHDKLLMALRRLLPIRRAWYSMIHELTYAYFYICNFNRYDTFVLILYGDVIIFTIYPRQVMMWCQLILAHDVDLEDDGIWQVSFVPRLRSLVFTSGHYSLDQDDAIAWVTSSLQMEMVHFGTMASTNL